MANRRDKQSQQRFCGTGVGKNKCPCRRRLRWRRSVVEPKKSLWESPIAVDSTVSVMSRSGPEFPGVLRLQTAYHDLYKLQQQHEYAVGDGEGPLWLFAPERLVLFLSFLCSTVPNVRIPNWPRDDKARFLYLAVQKLPELLSSTHRQKVALTNLQYFPGNLFMPAAKIPRLSLPAWTSFPGTRKVRKLIQSSMQRISSLPIRQWILKQMRVVHDPPRRSGSERNSKRVMSEFSRADFEGWCVPQFEELLKLQEPPCHSRTIEAPTVPDRKNVTEAVVACLGCLGTPKYRREPFSTGQGRLAH